MQRNNLHLILTLVLCLVCSTIAYRLGMKKAPAVDGVPASIGEARGAESTPGQIKTETRYIDRIRAVSAEPDSADRGLRETSRAWSTGDPVDALLSAAAKASVDDELRQLDQIAEALDEEGVEAAIEALSELPLGPQRTRMESAVARRWAAVNPLAAMAYAEAMGEPKRRHDLKREVLQSWAASEPLMAMEYARINPDNMLSETRMADVFDGVKNASPENIVLFLQEVDLSKHKYHLQDVVYEAYAKHPDAIVQWTESLPEGELRDAAMHRVIDHWARYDPIAAKNWMAGHVRDEFQMSANIELGESWARVDPEAAKEWALTLPEGERSPRVMEVVFKRWLQYESSTALDWLGAQKPEPFLDTSIEQVVSRTARSKPKDAVEWAYSISDDKRRVRAFDRVAYEWRRRDRKGFEGFIAGGDAPEHLVKRYAPKPKPQPNRGSAQTR